MPEPETPCPYCGTAMALGSAYLLDPHFDYGRLPSRPPRLRFNRGEDAQTLLDVGESRFADLCPKCGTAVIYPVERQID